MQLAVPHVQRDDPRGAALQQAVGEAARRERAVKASRVRADALVVARGLAASRAQAQALIMAGEVLLGDERRRAQKPGQLVPDDVVVAVAAEPAFVSRGGDKLEGALAALGVDVAGRVCLDVGASTGGFTDCLLQRGAAHVVALDVAYGELHWRMRRSSWP